MTPHTGYADVNGVRMFYEVHGAGQPLLLLHGGTCSIGVPAMGLDEFAESFQVIAPEQMGHGRSADDPGRAFRYHDLAETTIALLDHLQIERVRVVGVSDGGIIGLDLAIHHPERVQGLVAIGANFTTDGIPEKAWQRLLSAKPDDWPQELRETYESRSPDGAGHWPVVLRRIQEMWALEPSFADAQLRNISTPVLVVAGDRDLVTPEHSVALFRAIPGAQLCVLPDSRHGFVPIETIVNFLAPR